MRIAVVTGGTLADLDWLKARLSSYEVCMAVDRGLEAFESLNLCPDWIIGDFDSYRGNQSLQARYPQTEILTFPSVKDWTDTELALHKAFELCVSAGDKAREERIIDLYGAFGGRVDHMFANVMLLDSINQKTPRIRALDPDNEVERLFPGDYTLERRAHYNVSILSLEETSEVTLKGFDYDGEKLVLRRCGTLGISNAIREATGAITVHSGKVLLMQCRDRE